MARFFVAFYNPNTGRWEGVPANDADQAFESANGSAANAAAYTQKVDTPGKYAAFPIDGGDTANLTLANGANTSVTYTAQGGGSLGNQLQIRYVVAGNNTPLSVGVTGRDITVDVATDGGGVATSTATQVKDAVIAHGVAGTLVAAALTAGHDGTGIVAAQAYQFLTGGSAGGATVEELSPSNIPIITPDTWD